MSLNSDIAHNKVIVITIGISQLNKRLPRDSSATVDPGSKVDEVKLRKEVIKRMKQ